MTTDEMANQETRRCEILRVLKHQEIYPAVDEVNLIERDITSAAEKHGVMYAFIMLFELGRIYGVRQERARRAKRHER